MRKNKLNPNIEYRISKQFSNEPNSNDQNKVSNIKKLEHSDLFRISYFVFRILFYSFIFFGFVYFSFAEEQITILVSGQSHATLYPCSCPKAPNGGVARRATVIKNTKNIDKDTLILEAGGSFAGGNYDEHSQNIEQDKKRTEFYLESLVKMGYDAFLVSSEEFNFGEDYFKQMQSKYKLNYLSANLLDNLPAYIIKKIGNIKIAIIGITDERVKEKAQLQYLDVETTLSKVVSSIKKAKKADLIIVLSYLDEENSKKLINKIEGIDIWISSNNPFRPASVQDIGKVKLIMSAWQTKALTKINVKYNAGTPDINVENIDLTNDIVDDPEISSIIPACFTNADCAKPGYISKCENGGTKKAKCVFSQTAPINITVIKPHYCKTCDINVVVEKIKNVLPNLKTNIIQEDSKQAKELIEKLTIKMLPAYLFDKSIEKDQNVLSQINQIVKKTGDYYLIEPSFSGVSYFTNREKIPNRLDVFFDIGTKDIVKIFDVLQTLKTKNKDIDIHLNFLAIEDSKAGLLAKAGKYEVEEYLRSACIDKYYPDKLWYYLSCRLSDIESSWWDDCASKFGIEPIKIKGCAQTQEGNTLLKGFTKLTQEFEVVFGPTFVINNQEVFSSNGAPTVEELEKLFE